MINHLGYEVRPGMLHAEITFWNALGFGRITHPIPKHRGEWLRSAPKDHERPLYVYLVPNGLMIMPSRWNHVAFVPPHGLDAALSALERLPFTTSAEVAETWWGARRVFIYTPAGYRLELLEFEPATRWTGGPPASD